MRRRPPRSTRTDTLCPYTTLFRSQMRIAVDHLAGRHHAQGEAALARLRPVDAGHTVQQLLNREVHRGASALAALQFRRSEEHTSELQSLMRISYAVFCLKKKNHMI